MSEGSDGRVLLHCHAGCDIKDILASIDLKMRDLYENNGASADERKVVATYPYHDADGKLVLEVLRYEPKSFRQRRPDGNGGWIWNLTGVKRPLYKLADVEIARDVLHEPVYFVEGEKDADRLAGQDLVATTSLGGSGSWRPEYAEQLRGAHVVVVPDNDEPGKQYAAKVAASLQGVAASVKVVELPGLPPKGDVSDWLDAGHSGAELAQLAAAAPEWADQTPATSEPAPQRSRLQLLDRAEQHRRYAEWVVSRGTGVTKRIPTGLHPQLDTDTAGLGSQELTVFGMPFGTGKTTFGCNVALNAARAGHRVAYVTAEETAEEIRARMVARMTAIPMLDVLNRRVTKEQLRRLVKASETLAELPLMVASTEGMSMQGIVRELQKHAGEFEMVVLDNLQAFGKTQEEARPLALETASRLFRDYCKTNDVSGVLLSQVSAEGERKAVTQDKETGEYRLDHMAYKPRWSGDVEGVADRLVFGFSWFDLAPVVEHIGKLDLFLKKNRNGRKKVVYEMRVDFAKQFIGTVEQYAREFNSGARGTTTESTGDVLRVPDEEAAGETGSSSPAELREPGGLGPVRDVAGRLVHAHSGEAAGDGEGFPW